MTVDYLIRAEVEYTRGLGDTGAEGSARFGDPAGIEGTPAAAILPGAPIPEPTALATLAADTDALALCRGRRARG